MSNPRGVFEKVKDSNDWWIRYVDASGRLRREHAGRKSDAVDLVRKRKTEALLGKKLPEKLRKRPKTIGDLLIEANREILRQSKSVRLGHDKNDYRFETLYKALGSLEASSDMGKALTDALKAISASREWSSASYNRHRAFLIRAYSIAHLQVPHIERFKEPTGRVRFLTSEEETLIRAEITRSYPDKLAEFDLALHTGMRLSSQYNLLWRDVDGVAGQIHVVDPKNGDDYSVPLNRSASRALMALKMQHPESSHVCGDSYRKEPPSQKWFRRARKAAGLGDDVSWHTLRHTFATRLAIAGFDLQRIQKLMGHKSISMTVRYSHLDVEHLRSAVDAIDKNASGTTIDTGGNDTQIIGREAVSDVHIN